VGVVLLTIKSEVEMVNKRRLEPGRSTALFKTSRKRFPVGLVVVVAKVAPTPVSEKPLLVVVNLMANASALPIDTPPVEAGVVLLKRNVVADAEFACPVTKRARTSVRATACGMDWRCMID
jgi:hypothetical protein